MMLAKALRILFAGLALWPVNGRARDFVIRNDSFLKDGEHFNVRSGDLHYFRVPPAYWRDRVRRLRAMGLNTVTTYVAWNFHEETEGEITFEGWANVTAFLDIVHEEGMLAFLRPGPYICAEWEMGGLPAWLLAKPNLRLRTYETQYVAAVDRWFNTLLPKFRRYLYSEGGPIIMVQIENEYGYFGNCETNPDDAKYMEHLLELAHTHLGTNVLYSTVQGAYALAAGSPWKGDPRVLATVDGTLSDTYMDSWIEQKKFNAPGNSPRMWTELWTGWFSAWGNKAANLTSIEVGGGVAAMVEEDASFSLYMAHGGTNFGFWSGANSQTTEGSDVPVYLPDITSYDYNAPISEAADHNVGADGGDMFAAVAAAISSRYGSPRFKEPNAIPKVAYGTISLPEFASLFDNLDSLSSCNHEIDPGRTMPTMEDLGQHYGLILYRRERTEEAFASLALNFTEDTLHDRVQVFVDGKEEAVAYRPQCPMSKQVPGGHSMDLLVENMGRTNFGKRIYDYKGLATPPPVEGRWSVTCLPLQAKQVRSLPFKAGVATAGVGPIFRRGTLNVKGTPQDTFVDSKDLVKGYVWVNGFLLGRYWETAGPQHSLYLPAPLLNEGDNEIIVLELHGKHFHAAIHSTDVQRWVRQTPALRSVVASDSAFTAKVNVVPAAPGKLRAAVEAALRREHEINILYA